MPYRRTVIILNDFVNVNNVSITHHGHVELLEFLLFSKEYNTTQTLLCIGILNLITLDGVQVQYKLIVLLGEINLKV